MNKPHSTFTSEDAWSTHLARVLARRPDIRVGIGDDAAVVRSPGGDQDLVYTTDAVVESVHFEPGAEPQRIGHKMVGRLLSDLAAMGASPDFLLLNLVVPPETSAEFMMDLYRGAEALALDFGAAIIGGDTLTAIPLALHGFAAGHLPAGSAILRGNARAGDRVYVTGKLGDSLTGKHLDFHPRVHEGVWLREGGWATAMMDISDGLARDLPRLCRASGVGAVLHAASIPAHRGLSSALHDGEDYELLFTIPSARSESFEDEWGKRFDLEATAIGVMEGPGDGVSILHPDHRRETLPDGGYDHLSKDNVGG